MKRVVNDPHDRVAALLILGGTLLRFYNYCGWSLSNDELSALVRLQFPSLSEMILHGVKLNDMHPMGVQVFLWFWTHLFGIGECVVRLPFVLMGSASVWLFYLVARHWFGKPSALWSVAIFSALQFPILYSQLARPYSPGLFFSLLLVWAWSKIVVPRASEVKETPLKYYVVFTLAMTASMYTHYFSFLLAAIVGVTGLFYLPMRNWIKYIACAAAAFVLYIPNYPVMQQQFSVGGLGGDGGWLGKPAPDAIQQFLFYGFNSSLLVLSVVVAVAVASRIVFRKQFSWTSLRIVALVFALLPAIIAYVYSVEKNPVFQYSILLFGFPFIVMVATSFIPPAADRQWLYPIAVSLCLITAGDTIFMQRYYSTQHFGVFKDLVQKVAEADKKYGESKVEKTVNVINPYYVQYYIDQLCPGTAFRQYIVTDPAAFLSLRSIVQQSEKPYFLHGWSNNYHAPEVDQIIREKYPYMIDYNPWFNSGLSVYAQEPSAVISNAPKLLFFDENGFESLHWNNDSVFRRKGIAATGDFAILIDSTMEYASGFEMKAADLKLKKGTSFEIAVYGCFEASCNDMQLVFSVERGGENVLWRNAVLSQYITQPDKWMPAYFGYTIVEDVRPDDRVKVYFYNPSKKTMRIDDFRMRIVDGI